MKEHHLSTVLGILFFPITILLSWVVVPPQEEKVVLIWGRNPVPYSVPADLDFALLQIGGTSYSAYKIFMMAVSSAMFVSLDAIIARTRVGQIIQAVVG